MRMACAWIGNLLAGTRSPGGDGHTLLLVSGCLRVPARCRDGSANRPRRDQDSDASGRTVRAAPNRSARHFFDRVSVMMPGVGSPKIPMTVGACGALTALPGRPAREQELQKLVDRALRPRSAECGEIRWEGVGRRGSAVARRPTSSRPPVAAQAKQTGGALGAAKAEPSPVQPSSVPTDPSRGVVRRRSKTVSIWPV